MKLESEFRDKYGPFNAVYLDQTVGFKFCTFSITKILESNSDSSELDILLHRTTTFIDRGISYFIVSRYY